MDDGAGRLKAPIFDLENSAPLARDIRCESDAEL